jgi:tetratricopeptide (TPR) repeat protein
MLLLLAGCLALTGFVLRADALRGRNKAKSALAVLFGDGRRLFANHFLAKADAYFHRGRYPSIFEVAERQGGNHLVESLGEEADGPAHAHTEEEEGHVHGPECDHATDPDAHEHDESCPHAAPAAKPGDWIARLAAWFEPDRHVHLEAGAEKEMLPWVKLAVEMDPHNVEAYTVGGYWLRQMDKPKEAEAFLREGQRNNPESSEILFELGRLTEYEHGDLAKAARLYRLSLEKWHQASAGLSEPDTLALAQILGRLGKVQEEQGLLQEALRCYTLLKDVSRSPDGVQRLIDSIQARIAEASRSSPLP